MVKQGDADLLLEIFEDLELRVLSAAFILSKKPCVWDAKSRLKSRLISANLG